MVNCFWSHTLALKWTKYWFKIYFLLSYTRLLISPKQWLAILYENYCHTNIIILPNKLQLSFWESESRIKSCLSYGRGDQNRARFCCKRLRKSTTVFLMFFAYCRCLITMANGNIYLLVWINVTANLIGDKSLVKSIDLHQNCVTI